MAEEQQHLHLYCAKGVARAEPASSAAVIMVTILACIVDGVLVVNACLFGSVCV